jgi:DNA-binding CsgD family transcriptional regulator
MLAAPFVFSLKSDMYYIITIIVCVIITFLVNSLTNYSLFLPSWVPVSSYKFLYYKYQTLVFYNSLINNFSIMRIIVIYIFQKQRQVEQFYAEKGIVELKRINTQQELLISNLRISQKNKLLQKTRELDSKQINKLIRDENSKDRKFEDITEIYLDISPEFYRRLNEKATPNKLTATDLKYCAYIYAGKTSKDISAILSISYGSAKSHKHVLKHKLHLHSSESLDFFIQHILSKQP